MPKQKKTAAKKREMREKDRRRRLEAAAKKQEALPGPAPDPAVPGENGRPAAKKPEPRPAKKRRRDVPVVYHAAQSIRLTDAGDAGGDCRHYACELPRNADLKVLFDAIRDSRPKDETGTVYIRLGRLPSDAPGKNLSYTYRGGVFTRAEQFTKSNRDKLPMLADLLGEPVLEVRATGGWGRMDYFAVLPDNAGPEPKINPEILKDMPVPRITD